MIITAGQYKGQKIAAPDESITRPTLSKVRMSIFNTLQSMVNFDGTSFLDMYAGSGIMSLEAVSRGFGCAFAIEKNPKVYAVLQNNFKKYGQNLTSILGDSLNVVKRLDRKFDIIFIDPPYFSGIYEKSLDAVKNIAGKYVVIEHVTDVDFAGYELMKQKKYGDKYISYLVTK